MKKTSDKNKIPTALLAAAVLMTTACNAVFYHDPQKARKTAYEFLNAVYMEGDFNKAYALVDPEFDRDYGPGYLEKISVRFRKVFDKLDGLRADAYLTEAGERSMMLLFAGIGEKAPSYHRVMLAGDGSRGYTVSSVIYSDVPFTGYRTLKFFK